VLAGRLPWFPTLVTCAALDLVCLLILAALPGLAWFLLACGVFGFLWLFTLPFLVPMVIAADPSRRAAVLVGGAQLLGGSVGPLLVSMMVTDADARAAIAFGAGALAVALSIAFALRLREYGPKTTSV
jgi:hypothetical protein